jgi:alpha-L-arabinofuranosidase
MSGQARLVFDPAFAVGLVDPRLFGSFVEHLGRCARNAAEHPHRVTPGSLDGTRITEGSARVVLLRPGLR